MSSAAPPWLHLCYWNFFENSLNRLPPGLDQAPVLVAPVRQARLCRPGLTSQSCFLFSSWRSHATFLWPPCASSTAAKVGAGSCFLPSHSPHAGNTGADETQFWDGLVLLGSALVKNGKAT